MHQTIPPSDAGPLDSPLVACLASRGLPLIADATFGPRLETLLRNRGIRLVFDVDDCRTQDIAAVLVGPEPLAHDDAMGVAARRSGAPLLTLGRARAADRLRLGERDSAGDDRRLCRLLSAGGTALSDDLVTAAVAAFPARAGPRRAETLTIIVAPEPPPGWRRALDPERLAPLAAAHGLRLARTPDEASSVLLAAGERPEAWDALAQGHELICLGPSPFAGLGLTHDAADPSSLPSALASVATGRRNRRDLSRRALAVEALLNTFEAAPEALAAALDATISEVGRRPRRSVSIVVTNRNYRAFVGAAVASALAQTVPAREVVVVDDGSTDGSAELIAEMPGIVAVSKPQGGQASAFNAGFARTSGDLIVFLDADDRLLPEAVERIGTADEAGVSRLFFALEMIDAEGRGTGLYSPGTPGRPAAAGMLLGALVSRGIFPFVPTSGNVWPRRVLDRLLPMPEAEFRLCADLYLVLGAAALGETSRVADVLGQYRVHGRNGHFRRLGDGLHMAEARLRQRRLAWAHLADRARAAFPGALAKAAAGALERLGRLDDPEEVSGRSAQRDPATPPAAFAVIAEAGATSWPRLGPGAHVDLGEPTGWLGIPGRGWSEPSREGIRLTGREGTLAFRLPEVGGDWRLRLTFAVEGDAPLLGLELELNGTPIDRVDLHRLGTIDLGLPAELLADWRTIAPGPGSGACAACIALQVPAGDEGRLWISELTVEPLPPAAAPAPRLPTGETRWIAGDGFSDTCLGEGWDWPGQNGARLAAASGRIALSLAEPGPHALALVLGANVGDPLPVASQLRLVVNGTMTAGQVTVHPGGTDGQAACSTIVAALPPGSTRPDGRLDVGLQTCADPDTGDWPSVRLRGLRLDRLADGAGRPVLAPNLAMSAGVLVGHPATRAEGLVADGQVARIARARFKLHLEPGDFDSGGSLDARLLVRLGSAGPLVSGAVAATLRICRSETRVWFGRDVVVPLDLGRIGRRETIVLDGSVESRARNLILRSVELRRPPLGWEPVRVTPPMGELGPEALAACAADPGEWHPPVPDGLWLAGARACLRLPSPPPGTRMLAVSVLTLDAGRQRLRLELNGKSERTTRPGLEMLHLPLSAEAGAPLELVVTSDALVAADLVGASPPGALGGALCRVVAVAPPQGPEIRPEAAAGTGASRR